MTATQDEQPLNWYQHTATEILVWRDRRVEKIRRRGRSAM
jgi:hypothetical protein